MKTPLAALVSLAVVSGCTGDVTGPSLTGAPFVTATVNGVRWQVDSAGIFANFRLSDSTFSVNAQHITAMFTVTDGMLFTFRPVDTLGSYTLDYDRDPHATGSYYRYDSSPDSLPTIYGTVLRHVGSVQLTALDTLRHIATGRFAFDAQELGQTSVLRVLAGQFRVHYRAE